MNDSDFIFENETDSKLEAELKAEDGGTVPDEAKVAFAKKYLLDRAKNGTLFLTPDEWKELNGAIVDQDVIEQASATVENITKQDLSGKTGRKGITAARKARNLQRRPIRDGFMQALAELRPPFPFKFTAKDRADGGTAHKEFNELLCLDRDFVEWNSLDHYVSKYPSPEGDAPYKYPFDKLFVIVSSHDTYTEISNVFQEQNRLACPSYDYASPVDIWTKPEVAERFKWIFYLFWRMKNDRLNNHVYQNMFHLGTYTAGQFKPYVARAIYREIRPVEWGDDRHAERVLDTSCGWGDRLAGFYATPTTKEYVGCDPSDATFMTYLEQVKAYERWLGCPNPKVTQVKKGDPDDARWCSYPHNWFRVVGKKAVEIHQLPAEDFHPEPGFDLMFSSPPYFAVEQYNADGEDADMQSWKRYPGYEGWREGFFKPMLRMSYETLKEDGIMLVNIIDPKVKNKRFFSFDEMVEFIRDELGGSYLGHGGMQIGKRPRDTSNGKDLLLMDPTNKATSVRRNWLEDVGVFAKRPLTLQRGGGSVLDMFDLD